MTGNTKIWRAPLAGLASVAMLATMGVAAATANAADNDGSVHEADYTVTLKTGSGTTTVTAFPGETYADAYVRTRGSLPTLSYGEYSEGFDPYRTEIKSDMTVTVTKPASAVAVLFQSANGITVSADADSAVTLPFGASFSVAANGTLGAAAVPLDKAGDGKIITDWTVDYVDPDIKDKTVSTEELADVNVMNGGAVTIKPAKTAEAYTVTFGGYTESGAHVAGSYTDDTLGGGSYKVDVAKDGSNSVSVTAPDAVVSNESTSYKKLTGWSYNNTTVKPGETVSVNGDTTYTAATETMYRVYFVDPTDSNKVLQAFEVAKDGHVKAADVKEPTKTGYTFDGWYASYRSGSFSDKVKLTSAGYDFTGYGFTSSYVFYAKFVSSDTINVTFSAGDYDGAGEEKTVKYSPDAFVKESDAPEYTRAGYVLSGWTLNGNAYNFDKQTAGKANNGKDFKLVAKWTIVTADVAKAALEYINPDKYVTNKGAVAGTATDNTAMGDFFTAASWSEYKTAYKAAKQKYQSADYKGDITPAVSAEVVSDLKAAWEKLVFKHTSGANVLAGVTVHRLSKGSDHFYTQDTAELLYMTAVEGWTDEGRLFDASNKAGAGYFASFDNIRKTDGTTSFSDQVIDQLAEAADEIVEPVYRAYNKVTGDHVWTVDANEYASLEAQKDWNAESAAFYTPTFTGTTDVMRLYKSSAHLMSTDANEVKVLSTKMGWTDEGVAFKAY